MVTFFILWGKHPYYMFPVCILAFDTKLPHLLSNLFSLITTLCKTKRSRYKAERTSSNRNVSDIRIKAGFDNTRGGFSTIGTDQCYRCIRADLCGRNHILPTGNSDCNKWRRDYERNDTGISKFPIRESKRCKGITHACKVKKHLLYSDYGNK